MVENVIVSGDGPLLETQKPIQAVNIAGDFLRELPLSTRRDVTDVLEATPGVTARNFIANNGTQVYMLRGTDVEQHVVQIDGADMGSLNGIFDVSSSDSSSRASAPISVERAAERTAGESATVMVKSIVSAMEVVDGIGAGGHRNITPWARNAAGPVGYTAEVSGQP